jgi:hypothetical protein
VLFAYSSYLPGVQHALSQQHLEASFTPMADVMILESQGIACRISTVEKVHTLGGVNALR